MLNLVFTCLQVKVEATEAEEGEAWQSGDLGAEDREGDSEPGAVSVEGLPGNCVQGQRPEL